MKKPTIIQAAQDGARLLFRGQYSLSFDQLEFPRRNIPLRKRINHLIQGVQLLSRTAYGIRIPPILQLEPSNVCNLNCLTCATGAKLMTRSPDLMSFEMFKSIIDQVKDYVHLLVFWSWGEPFTNKNAVKMIRYAKERRLLVHTSTNGHFFQTREIARDVVNSGLDSLLVAVDGLDQVTYEKYRKGGSLHLVIRSIKNLVAERTSAGMKHPRITFRFIVMKHNEHQVDRVQEFAEQLGADFVSFRSAVVQRAGVSHKERLTPDLAEYKKFVHEGSPPAEPSAGRNNLYCHRPYANLTVFSNGDVVSCENDFNATLPLGNVSNQSIQEILNSHKSRALFSRFSKNLDHFSFCRACELRNLEEGTHNVQTHQVNRKLHKREKVN